MARRSTSAATSRPSTGQPAAHLAAFDTTTNALSTDVQARRRLAGAARSRPSEATVYVGGFLRSADGQARTSSRRSTPPTARAAVGPRSERRRDRDGRGAGRLAGHRRRTFHHLNGSDAYGMGSVDATSRRHPAVGGQPAHPRRRHDGRASRRCAPTEPRSTAPVTRSARAPRSRGSSGPSPSTGAINFVNDCHGDTYDVFPLGPVCTPPATCTPASGSERSRTPIPGRSTTPPPSRPTRPGRTPGRTTTAGTTGACRHPRC